MTQNPSGAIRPGEISAVYPDRMTARVWLPDLDVVTGECQIVVPAAVKSHDYRLPEVGETVLVAFLGTGIETGFILGCCYTAGDPVPVSSADVRHWSMEGGGAIEIDRAARTLTIVDSYGSAIKMAGGDIIIQSANNLHLNPGSADIPAHLSAIFD